MMSSLEEKSNREECAYEKILIVVSNRSEEAKMTRLKIALLTVVMIVSSNAAMADKRNFSLTNGTGYDIHSVFVDSSNSNSWSDDIMGRDIFRDGETIDINFEGADKGCKWDLKVEWTDNSPSTEWHDFNLCEITSITLKYNRKTDTTTAVTR